MANLYIISAPSGTGKTSLVQALLHRNHITTTISYTTRKPRKGEKHGEHYHFISDEEFEKMLEDCQFLEEAEIFGHKYGTSQLSVEKHLQTGKDVILEIDWQGALQVKKLMPEAISIFILPPSLKAVEERLRTRGKDSEEVIKIRLSKTKEEISHYIEYDYIVINDNFNVALNDLNSIIHSNRLTLNQQMNVQIDLLSKLLN